MQHSNQMRKTRIKYALMQSLVTYLTFMSVYFCVRPSDFRIPVSGLGDLTCRCICVGSSEIFIRRVLQYYLAGLFDPCKIMQVCATMTASLAGRGKNLTI